MLKFLVSDDLWESLPIEKEKKKKVLSKINEFAIEFEDKEGNIDKIQKGFYPRLIKGNKKQKIYKIRVNISDRVLFTYGKYLNGQLGNNNNDKILFLKYCNHDEQIREGIKIDINKDYSELNLQEKEEIDRFDAEIDETYKNFEYDTERMITRIINSVDDEEIAKMIDDGDERALYYLSDKQSEMIEGNKTPLFMFGSAGSGKTTVGINKAFSLCYGDRSRKIGYFTYSGKLVNESADLFYKLCESEGKICENKNGAYKKHKSKEDRDKIEYTIYSGNKDESDIKYQVNFYNLNEYIGEIIKDNSYVEYREFEKWYDKVALNKKGFNINVSKRDIWKEIRGIIKGLNYIDWLEIFLDKFELNENTIEFLINRKLCIDMDDDRLKIVNKNLANLMDEVKRYKEDYINEITDDLSYIYKTIDKRIYEDNLMDRNIYLGLSSKYSMFEKEEKEYIYDVAVKYQNWLNKENHIDENDMIRMCLKKYYENNNSIEKYDFIICDEVQDLTELQLYFLCKIVKNGQNVFFSGDYNQTINPTYFDTGRIESLYKINNGIKKFNKEGLELNYRSIESVVELANEINLLRRSKLKMTDSDYKDINEERVEITEKAIRTGEDKPFLLRNTQTNINRLINIGKQRHYVGIVVPDEEEKERIEKLMNIKNGVYTVGEIKGIEKDYIICLNVMSKYAEIWKKIFKEELTEDDMEKFRYYFNLMYVAITRARNNICFIEDDEDTEIYRRIKDYIKVVNKFNIKSLKLDKESYEDDYIREGKKQEKNGLFEKAIFQYTKIKNENLREHYIKRCEALIIDKEGEHINAGNSLMKIEEYEHAIKCYKKAKDYVNTVKAMVYAEYSYEEMENELSAFDQAPYEIVRNIKTKKHKWMDKFEEIYKQYKIDMLIRELSKMSYGIENINKISSDIGENIKILKEL